MKKITLLISAIIYGISLMAKTPTINSVIDIDEYDAKISIGDQIPCSFNKANCKEMYFAQDADYYYLGVMFAATMDMNWGFIINCQDKDGETYDPRPRKVIYEHPKKPNLLLTGSFLSPFPYPYSAYIASGGFWTSPITFLNAKRAHNISATNENGCLEIAIPKVYLGTISIFDVQFYLSDATTINSTFYDAIPDDNVPSSKTTLTALHNYASAIKALPINLTSFNAELVNNTVALDWDYNKEYNFSHFEIIRNDIKIGSTIRKSFQDFNPSTTNYYKLKMIDKDGSFQYSKTININLEVANIKLLQNPIRSEIRLSFNGEQNQYNIVVYDMQGKKLFQTIYNHNGSITYQSFKLPSIIRGNYRLFVNDKHFNILVEH